jgi:hypothetical protein
MMSYIMILFYFGFVGYLIYCIDREPWTWEDSIGLDNKNKLGVRSSKRAS